jgi:hypothetical protein
VFLHSKYTRTLSFENLCVCVRGGIKLQTLVEAPDPEVGKYQMLTTTAACMSGAEDIPAALAAAEAAMGNKEQAVKDFAKVDFYFYFYFIFIFIFIFIIQSE